MHRCTCLCATLPTEALWIDAWKVWGIDIDEIAVEVARKNLLQNQINTSMYRVVTGNLVDNVTGRFHIITANITSDAVLLLLDDVKKVWTDGGIVICSGMIEENKDPVIEKMKIWDLTSSICWEKRSGLPLQARSAELDHNQSCISYPNLLPKDL